MFFRLTVSAFIVTLLVLMLRPHVRMRSHMVHPAPTSAERLRVLDTYLDGVRDRFPGVAPEDLPEPYREVYEFHRIGRENLLQDHPYLK